MTDRRSGVRFSTPRTEERKRLVGEAEFTADIRRPGMIHASFVRSHLAHSVVRSIDASEAASAPGVIGVFLSDDLGDLELAAPQHLPGPMAGMTRPVLASSRTRYVGEPHWHRARPT